MSLSKSTYLFIVTGTFHGAHVCAISEGEARSLFHLKYRGESIIHVCNASSGKVLQTYKLPFDQ
jgi:hypothetical protein